MSSVPCSPALLVFLSRRVAASSFSAFDFAHSALRADSTRDSARRDSARPPLRDVNAPLIARGIHRESKMTFPYLSPRERGTDKNPSAIAKSKARINQNTTSTTRLVGHRSPQSARSEIRCGISAAEPKNPQQPRNESLTPRVHSFGWSMRSFSLPPPSWGFIPPRDTIST